MQSQAQVATMPNILYSGGDEAKLGAGGMADTRDPEPFVNETDKRQSISQAPSFEEYLKSRQFAADSRVPNIFFSGGDDAKLGAGGMADTRDPEPFVNETDKRQSISQAPSFEEYLKSRQFAADSR